ncbi:ATP-binding cassette domain-containing protein [Aliiroseovarius sp.]|uniref:thiamine ABC transporter ATP-binding protein n=1 Tax=Aliiroseovarius sp. TaxID=1872442 RepID=UPI0026090C42|nr:ATP-binding cassette domain-containing protein [Aliiroseovarius sp.]
MLTLEGMRVEMEGFTLDAELSVPTGARVAVLGPSGAGKSTLLGAIAGFQPVAAGRVLWKGAAMPAAPAKRPVSMVFQDNNLFPHLSAFDNVAMGLSPSLRLSEAERVRVGGALQRVGLNGYGDRKPGRLSGGQVARVALARVLLRDRPLLLLDEPFGALGPALKAEMLSLVADLLDETGATLMMVSHEPQDARLIADHVVLVAEGRAHAPVSTGEIFANPPEALRDYLGQA